MRYRIQYRIRYRIVRYRIGYRFDIACDIIYDIALCDIFIYRMRYRMRYCNAISHAIFLSAISYAPASAHCGRRPWPCHKGLVEQAPASSAAPPSAVAALFASGETGSLASPAALGAAAPGGGVASGAATSMLKTVLSGLRFPDSRLSL